MLENIPGIFGHFLFIVEPKIRCIVRQHRKILMLMNGEKGKKSDILTHSTKNVGVFKRNRLEYVHIQSDKLTLSACRHYIYRLRFLDKIY